jgi:hypothetical protein
VIERARAGSCWRASLKTRLCYVDAPTSNLEPTCKVVQDWCSRLHLFLGIDKLEDCALVVSHNSLAVVPVNRQGSEEVILVFLELLQRVLLVAGTLDDARDTTLSNIAQNRLHLILGWVVFGNVQLEWVSGDLVLSSVVARLILRGARSRIGRSLLEQVGDLCRTRRARLVEERDDIEGFAESKHFGCFLGSVNGNVLEKNVRLMTIEVEFNWSQLG